MLGAIVAVYHVNNSIIRTIVITTAVGVRQGCEPDGFLSWLHLLILMDDTVLLLTSRVAMKRNVSILCTFCKE